MVASSPREILLNSEMPPLPVAWVPTGKRTLYPVMRLYLLMASTYVYPRRWPTWRYPVTPGYAKMIMNLGLDSSLSDLSSPASAQRACHLASMLP